MNIREVQTDLVSSIKSTHRNDHLSLLNPNPDHEDLYGPNTSTTLNQDLELASSGHSSNEQGGIFAQEQDFWNYANLDPSINFVANAANQSELFCFDSNSQEQGPWNGHPLSNSHPVFAREQELWHPLPKPNLGSQGIFEQERDLWDFVIPTHTTPNHES